MKFYYQVIGTECVDIDFKELFTYISNVISEDDKGPIIETIYYEFLDNMDFYIKEIYPCQDLYDDDNEQFYEDVQDAWEDFLKEEYGFV